MPIEDVPALASTQIHISPSSTGEAFLRPRAASDHLSPSRFAAGDPASPFLFLASTRLLLLLLNAQISTAGSDGAEPAAVCWLSTCGTHGTATSLKRKRPGHPARIMRVPSSFLQRRSAGALEGIFPLIRRQPLIIPRRRPPPCKVNRCVGGASRSHHVTRCCGSTCLAGPGGL